MSDDEYGRVPAGWYPDPLGLPQLRWWDNHSWTEHVSDARQPMMSTPVAAPTMYADDELPTRRGRRSTESAPSSDDEPLAQPTAATLRQLAPPSTAEAPPLVEPSVPSAPVASVPSAAVPPSAAPTTPPPMYAASAPAQPASSVPSSAAPASSVPANSVPSSAAPTATPADAFAAAAFADLAAETSRAATQQTDAPWVPMQTPSAPVSSNPFGVGAGSPTYGSPAYGSAPGAGSPAYGSAPGYGSAPNAPAFTPAWSESPVSASDPGRRGTHQALGTTAPHLQTIEVWAIALLPMLQLLLSLLVVAAFSTGPSVAFMAAIWLGPLPIIIVLALLDARTLRRRGVDRVASGWWAALGAPIFLIVRAVSLSRISGSGYGPVGVALLLTGLVGASILAVPGLIIAAFPAVFAAEASNSIELNARSIGAAMEASCPATPPLFIGQQLRCPAVNASGENIVVTVSLQRSNGWIAWQVDDWGIFSVVR